jgi:hypothetical protein
MDHPFDNTSPYNRRVPQTSERFGSPREPTRFAPTAIPLPTRGDAVAVNKTPTRVPSHGPGAFMPFTQ